MAWDWKRVLGRTMQTGSTTSSISPWGAFGYLSGLQGGIFDEAARGATKPADRTAAQIGGWISDPFGMFMDLLNGKTNLDGSYNDVGGPGDAAAAEIAAFNAQQQAEYEAQMKYLKDLTDDALGKANTNYASAEGAAGRMRGFQGQAGGEFGLARGAFQDLASYLRGDQAQTLDRNAQQNYDQLQEFYNTGGNVTGVDAATLQMQQLANQNVASQYGPGMQGSGAYTAAASAGMTQPLSEYNQFIKNLGLQTLNQQQGAVGLQNSIFNQGIQGRQAVGSGYLGTGAGFANLGQQSLGEANMFAGIGNQWNSNATNYAGQQQGVTKTYTAEPIGAADDGTDWGSLIQTILGLVSTIGGAASNKKGSGGGSSNASNDGAVRPQRITSSKQGVNHAYDRRPT